MLLLKQDLILFKSLKPKQLQTQTSLLLNLQTQKAKQPLPLLKNLVVKLVQMFLWQLTLMLTVSVLKSFKKMVATLTFQGIKSVLSWLNTSWKLIKMLELFLKMLPSANLSFQLTW
ncbi:Uncharacterised protein [Mycobacteroides abscessus subsp. abscessus]|nr:Uncharacterised protein [Mycobacteroides abscessus subsp. abscessus]